MSLMFIEIITYIIFVYTLCVLFVFIKPNMFFLIIFFCACLLGSWLILIDCRMKLLDNIIFKFFILVIFSTLCTLIYLLIHENWSNLLCKLFILVLPVLFYFMVKTVENVFDCDKYHVFTTPIRFIEIIFDFLSNLNDKLGTFVKN